MESFQGNAYIFMPLYFKSNSDIVSFMGRYGDCCDDGSYSKSYIDNIECWYNQEISKDLQTSLTRCAMGKYLVVMADGVEQFDYTSQCAMGEFVVTVHKQSLLAVLTICLPKVTQPVTGLLDRVSSETICILTDPSDNTSTEDVEDLLKNNYGLLKSNSARVFLSTKKMPSDKLLPYYFACETFDSENMSAKLRPERFSDIAADNIAQYDSSDTFIGHSTILRIDQRSGLQGEFVEKDFPTVKSDTALLYIAELVVFRDAALSRTNRRVLSGLSRESSIGLGDMEEINLELGKTVSFWSLDIFNYITAQNLANKINCKFGIDRRFKSFHEHQTFLQSRLNIRQVIIQKRENMVLYLIAIILFIFETVPVFYSIISNGLSGSINIDSVLSSLGGMGISGAMLIIIILLINRDRKGDLNSHD